MQPIATIVVAVVVSVIAPAVLAFMTNRNRRKERREDYARQDAVAEQAATAARLLLESNELVALQAAEATRMTQGQLRQIHSLVNNNLDKVLRELLAAMERVAELTEEGFSIKRRAGLSIDPTAQTVLDGLYMEIQGLRTQIRDRVGKTLAGEAAKREE